MEVLNRRGLLRLSAAAIAAGVSRPAKAGFLLNPYTLAAGAFPFSSVVFLSGFEGADGSTTIIDESSYARTITASGSTITTAQFKYGSSSLTGAFASAADSTDFDFGTGPFAIECWVRWNATSGVQGLISKSGNTAAAAAWALCLNAGVFGFRGSDSGGSNIAVTVAHSFSTGVWYHVLAERDGSNVLRVFVDGVMITSATVSSTILASSGDFLLGRWVTGAVNRNLNGWIDEARVIKGAFVHGSDTSFTPPAGPLPRS
jgi:hypothetical protein